MLNYISLANAAVPAALVPVDVMPANAVLTEIVLADSAALASAAPAGPLSSVATSSRVRPGAGTSLRCGRPTWLRSDAVLGEAFLASQGTLPASRQARSENALIGSGTHAAGLVTFARKQRTTEKFAHLTKMYTRPTTRIATNGGGAWGPHPARDPV